MTEGTQHYDLQEDIESNTINEINTRCEYHTQLFLDGTNKFLVLHMNVRSMKNKKDDIDNLLRRIDVTWDIICISETWLRRYSTSI